MPSDPDLPPLFDRARALSAGLTRHQITQRVRSGVWTPLRRGRYVVTERFVSLPAREQQALRIVAALAQRGQSDAASHLSGALVHGWGAPFDGWGPPTVTSADLSRSARRRGDLVVQVATLPDGDIRTVDVRAADESWPVRATGRARTLADCLRHLPLEDSVAIADSALRAADVSWDAIRNVLDRQEPWPYLARGRRALRLLDPRRESYLESFSFIRLWQRGVPMPEPQVVIRDPHGGFVARVDGWVDAQAIALEADGAAKYLLDDDGAATEASSTQLVERVRRAMVAQSRREEQLRELGVRVVRWTTVEMLRRPDAVAARVRRAGQGSTGSRFRGTASAQPRPPWLD